ncbi:putative alpha-1A adrenergic receptor-like [Apostichopus japonicus]|uniref:Putative alpha-1A adrenergic receptor-like n=1 Tax=Stichopus japonicus TaxID=307972 RepID=A0A2G8K8C7_STIJA|nr:putative alpha-1A adrenergic receptor-like [Apostichopus japonicus]
MEDYSYINENFSSYIPPMREHVISGIVYSLISVLGMIGNGCVILAVIYVRTLQTTTNVFIVNLAVADFLASSLLPLYTVSFWTDNFFPSLDILCALTTGLLRACLAASSFNLASIGINRLLIVIQAKSIYKVLFSPKSMTIWIICLWVCALSLSYVPHFMGIGRIGYTIRPHQCGIIPANPGTKTAHTILTLGMYPVPFCIIVVCYSWIYCYVYRHNARMMKYEIEKPNATSSTISSADPASS